MSKTNKGPKLFNSFNYQVWGVGSLYTHKYGRRRLDKLIFIVRNRKKEDYNTGTPSLLVRNLVVSS